MPAMASDLADASDPLTAMAPDLAAAPDPLLAPAKSVLADAGVVQSGPMDGITNLDGITAQNLIPELFQNDVMGAVSSSKSEPNFGSSVPNLTDTVINSGASTDIHHQQLLHVMV